jgi:hypothetical protein
VARVNRISNQASTEDTITPEDALIDRIFDGQRDFTREELETCLMRGWVEQLPKNIQYRVHQPPGKREPGQVGELAEHYRVTSQGWSALNRTHTWQVWTFRVAVFTLVVTVVTLTRSCVKGQW